MGLFNERDMRSHALRNPAVMPTEEQVSPAIDDLLINNYSLFLQDHLYDRYEALNEDTFNKTGKRQQNPMTNILRRGLNARGRTVDDEIEEWHEERAKIAQKFPEDVHATSYQDLLDEASEIQKISEFIFNDISERTFGFTDNAQLFLGSAIGSMQDPLITLPMALGVTRASTILTGALIEVGLGLASETAVQVRVRSQRKELGRRFDATQAAMSIGMAGAAGGAFYAGFRGIGKGYGKTRQILERSRAIKDPSPDVRAAQRYLDYVHWKEDNTPWSGLPGESAVEAHLARLRRAEYRVYGAATSRALDVPDVENLKPHIRFYSEVADETPEQFAARVKESSPETFARMDEVNKRIPETTQRLSQIGTLLSGPKAPEVPTTGSRGAAAAAQAAIVARTADVLPEKPKAPTDIPGRKAALAPTLHAGVTRQKLKDEATAIKDAGGSDKAVKAARKKIFEHEKETGGSVLKKEKLAKAKMKAIEAEEKALKAEQKKLSKERRDLKSELGSLQTRSEYAVGVLQRADVRAKNIQALVETETKHPTPSTEHTVAVAQKVKEAVDEVEKLPEAELDRLVKDAEAEAVSAKSSDLAPDEATAAKQGEVAEQQALDFMNENLEEKFWVIGEDGQPREMSAQQFLDDFDDDQKLLAALRDCIKGAL